MSKKIPEYSAAGRKVFVPKHKQGPTKQSGFSKFLSKLNPATMFANKGRQHLARSIMVNQPLPTGPNWRDKKGRIVKDKVYPTNQNITSKYTVITFLPRNLLEQFRRIANIFFLAIAILQFFPKFATISPGLVILPLLAVLTITALKDGYEDVKRHQADRKVNYSLVHVLKGGEGYHGGPLAYLHHTNASEAQPGYHNYNAMAAKSKTFVPAIPLPRGRSKKQKEEGKASMQTTEALKEGMVKEGDKEWQNSRPSGGSFGNGESPFGDQHRAETPGPVVSAATDPEAFDDLSALGWQQTIWEDVRVGDFVKIYDNDPIPADIVICSTSEEEDVAYVETKNLDGETNLKSRHGVAETTHLRTAEACGNARFQIDAEPADVNMYRLNGAVVFPGEQTGSADGKPLVHPIDLQTTILRGCVLKNTGWIIGVVIYTGADTKIIMNSGGTPSKRSRVEKQMNPMVLLNLVLLAVVAAVCAVIDWRNEVRWDRQQAYWELYANRSGDNPRINGLVTFANAFITFQNIVPISLYISIEFVRTAQALFIYWDHSIKYVKNGVTTRTTARSWNLSDDLGQVEYVFSDKTGTLTQNSMVFRQCSIGGKVYTGDGEIPEGTVVEGHSVEMSEAPSSDSSDTPLSKKPEEHPGQSNKPKTVLPKEVLAPFHDPELLADLNNTETEQSRLLHGFFAVLGLCHTALAAEIEPGLIEYKAQSPDEAALVQAAADVGFVFRGRDKNIMRLSTPFSDEPDEYELLQVLEFNSTRKRMSVILRKLDEDNRIFLLCKGADNVIFERLAKGNEELKKKTDADLQYFAGEGLRTLCLAYRLLDEAVYNEWAARFHNASVAIDDREAKIEVESETIEKELILLGSTAIEDRLQDGVPEAIADLKRAGIKVWVATGDKLETAVAIGYTTNLLTKDSNMIVIREGSHTIYDQLRNALEIFFNEEVRETDSKGVLEPISNGGPGHELRRLDTGVTSLVGQDNGTRTGGYSLVIDGGALRHAFSEPATEELLLHLSTQCNTVICCRVSPLQKAQIVRLVKDNLGSLCLAIGDGANDVSMIQAADIGVGISGEEGLQAVNSSDYAIAQFRYLKRLLFVHGHWSYLRNSNMILNFFYKNVMGVGVLFWFQIYCGWSTTYVFEYTYLLFWNIFWTLLPVIALGLFDRDVDADTLMALPELYKESRDSKWFSIRRFMYYVLQGAYQSAVVYFFINYAYVTTTTRTDGYNVGQYEMSTVMAIGAVMVANVFTGLNTETWTIWVWVAIAVGPVLIWVYTAIYSIIPPSAFATYAYGNDTYLFPAATFWFGWIFVFFLALAPQYMYRFIRHSYAPTDVNTMAYIRRYHPEIDVENDPMLGGKVKAEREAAAAPSRPSMSQHQTSYYANVGDSNAFGAQDRDQVSQMQTQTRPSMDSRRDPLGRSLPHSMRGSEVDMSSGIRRIESRGFDFDVEERSVAVARLNSRLSQISGNRSKNASLQVPDVDSPNKRRMRTGSINLGLSSLRTRAGSVLRPKGKGFFEGTKAMEGERGPEDTT